MDQYQHYCSRNDNTRGLQTAGKHLQISYPSATDPTYTATHSSYALSLSCKKHGLQYTVSLLEACAAIPHTRRSGSLLFLHPVSPLSLKGGGSSFPCLMRRILEIVAPTTSFLLIIKFSCCFSSLFFPPLDNLIPWLPFNLGGHCLKEGLLL